jgi:universal stress protein E
MSTFQKILFASQAVTDDVTALEEALATARRNQADLSALIVCPEFPAKQAKYRERYEASLVQHLDASILAARAATGISAEDVPVPIHVDRGSTPAVRIIQHVQRHGADLLIKEAEQDDADRGFKAVDMELLRKCPCPVWLSRPGFDRTDGVKVAVAIDPQGADREAEELSARLLRLARSVSDQFGCELQVVSCWDFPFEEYLRDNVWIEMSDEEILDTVLQTQRVHRTALDRAVKKSAIVGQLHVHHVRGQPDKALLQFVADHHIDLLVMGTVARTGIPGFVIGNTAENVFRKLDCALLAVKPAGFGPPLEAT